MHICNSPEYPDVTTYAEAEQVIEPVMVESPDNNTDPGGDSTALEGSDNPTDESDNPTDDPDEAPDASAASAPEKAPDKPADPTPVSFPPADRQQESGGTIRAESAVPSKPSKPDKPDEPNKPTEPNKPAELSNTFLWVLIGALALYLLFNASEGNDTAAGRIDPQTVDAI
jgi:uncharacterized membrane protein